MPNASGFCLIQMAVMGVVLQGVGAADKLWNIALSYLNQGLSGVQFQMDTKPVAFALTPQDKANPNYIGAASILSGQVCMLGLQHMFEKQRAAFLNQAQSNPSLGVCGPMSATYRQWQAFCTLDVPNFLASVNAIQFQKKHLTTLGANQSYRMPMPNFPDSAPAFYRSLNGICGSVFWNDPIYLMHPKLNIAQVQIALGMDASALKRLMFSRAIAIQEMYHGLANVAFQMVQNDPQLNDALVPGTKGISPVAAMQYGLAMTNNAKPCQAFSDACQSWRSVQGVSGVLFAGNEFLTALNSYNATMMPVLNTVSDFQKIKQTKELQSVESKVQSLGWMSAGSYLFQMTGLKGQTASQQPLIDYDSGLEKSHLYNLQLDCKSSSASLCELLKETNNSPITLPLQQIQALIDGYPNHTSPDLCDGASLSLGGYKQEVGFILPNNKLSKESCASTTLGYIGNSYFLSVPGQSMHMPRQLPDFKYYSNHTRVNWNVDVPCGGIDFVFFKLCLVQTLSKPALWIGKNLLDSIWLASEKWGEDIFNIMVVSPLRNMIWPCIQNVFTMLAIPTINPIVSIANMGAYLMHSALSSYMNLLGFTGLASIANLGILGWVFYALALPFYTTWLVLFLMIGLLAAYYVPLLPLILFTLGVLAWIMAVIEAMVVGFVIALRVISPEFRSLFSLRSQGFVCLLNAFLRPLLMTTAYMTAVVIILATVWILNQVLSHVLVVFISHNLSQLTWIDFMLTPVMGTVIALCIYILLYALVAQHAFNLIYILPERLLGKVNGPGAKRMQQYEVKLNSASEGLLKD